MVDQFCCTTDPKTGLLAGDRPLVEPLSHAGFEFLHQPFDVAEVGSRLLRVRKAACVLSVCTCGKEGTRISKDCKTAIPLLLTDPTDACVPGRAPEASCALPSMRAKEAAQLIGCVMLSW